MYGTLHNPNPARSAFSLKDPDSSRIAHVNQNGESLEGHKSGAEFLRALVYGGLDGILTAFSIVSASGAADLRPSVILVVGISNLVADAFAMGVGEVVSEVSYLEHVTREARREEWEFDNFAEGEIEEMIDLYTARGLPRDKAITVVTTMSKYRDFFISVMVLEELQLKIPDPSNSPYKDGLITFASFLVFGSVPLIGYVIFPVLIPGINPDFLLSIAFILTGVVLFSLGTFKSAFSSLSWWKSGLEFLILGLLVAITSYGIGTAMLHLLPREDNNNNASNSSSGNGGNLLLRRL